MQRPVMDPTYITHAEAPAKPKRHPLVALCRGLWKLVKFLLTEPLFWRGRLKIEDGKLWQRFVRGLIYRLALAPVLLVAFLVLLVLAATHPGRAAVGADPLAYGMYFDPVNFLSDDNIKLEAWLVPAVDAKRVSEEKEATLTKKYPAVVLVHDFAGSRQQLLPLVRPLHDRGFVVLVMALRGSGALTSDAQTFGLNEALDVKAGVEMLRRRAYVDSSKIAVLGTGSGANAALLAARKDPSIKTIVVSNPIDGFDEAFARRVGENHAWLPPLRTLFRWTFEVMYSVDTEDLRMRNFQQLIATRPVLVMDPKKELITPSAVRDVEQFLAARMGVPETVAAGAQ